MLFYIADCGMPEIPSNGMVSYNSTVEGSMANYTCDEGYILDGVVQRICEENGRWSGDVQCQRKLIGITTTIALIKICLAVDCGAPPIPTNGGIIAPSTTFGAVMTHTCDSGFVLCGENNRTCQSNRSWSGSTPNCTSKACIVILNCKNQPCECKKIADLSSFLCHNLITIYTNGTEGFLLMQNLMSFLLQYTDTEYYNHN